jgi:acyl carrier protein
MSDIRQLNGIDIKKKVKEFINENFLLNSDCKTLDDTDSLLQKGIIDSTGVLELVSFIEKTFTFRVEDEELMPDNLDSIKKLVDFIKSKLAACSLKLGA